MHWDVSCTNFNLSVNVGFQFIERGLGVSAREADE
jgi:hypothetical protein